MPIFNTSNLAERQRRIVLLVQNSGSATRGDLAQALDLPLPTVNRIVSNLRDDAILLEDQGSASQLRGRPNGVITINPAVAYALGIEFGREYWQWAISDAASNIVARGGLRPVTNGFSPASVVEILKDVRLEIGSSSIGWDDISVIVFAVHTIVSAEGDVYVMEKRKKTSFNIDAIAHAETGKHCFSSDPARMFCLVEHDPQMDGPDAVYVLYGERGLGMGIVVRDQILNSFSGICGEIGYIVVDSEQEGFTTLGMRSIGELLVGEASSRDWARDLRDGGADALTLGRICEAARTGHAGAIELLSVHADLLAAALASTVSIIGSRTIVLGGDWSDSGEIVRKHLASRIKARLTPPLSDKMLVRYARNPADCISPGAALWGSRLIWGAPELSIGQLNRQLGRNASLPALSSKRR